MTTPNLLGARSSRAPGLPGLFATVLLLLSATAQAATFVVNSDGDGADASPGNGVCSTGAAIVLPTTPPLVAIECTLRAAIEEANALAGADTVEFSGYLPTVAGVVEISPASSLPAILSPITIDGYSHPDYAVADPGATPIINLLGGSTAPTTHGLVLLPGADGSVVRGLAIADFPGSAIVISAFFSAGPTGVVVQGNHLGIWRGVFYRGNDQDGVWIASANDNFIGPVCGSFVGCTGKRNVISSHDRHGVHLSGSSSGNQIAGNYIGVDRFGSSTFVPFGGATPNAEWGVYVDFDADANWVGSVGSELVTPPFGTRRVASGNLISGNGAGGVFLGSDANFVRANSIGTNLAGTGALGNDGTGVTVYGDDNVIGGPTVSGNLISGNDGTGIYFETPSGATPLRTRVSNNRIGVDGAGAAPLGNGGNGLTIWGGDHVVEDNLIGGNGLHGISDTGYSGVIASNYIGTNAAGADLGNALDGITLGEGNELIGGAGDGNVIGFNRRGIVAGGSSYQITVQGNWIGTNAAGDDLGNLLGGLQMSSGGYVVGGVGGRDNGLGNVIAWNGGEGVEAGGFDPVVEGNWIGTDASGTAMGNAAAGVLVTGVSSGTSAIGGSLGTPPVDVGAAGNVIAWNGQGLVVDGTESIALRGNQLRGNGGPGIDLGDDGVTPNDFLDADAGANRLQNTPVIDPSQTTWNDVTGQLAIRWGLSTSGPPDVDYPLTVDFYIHDPWLLPGDEARFHLGEGTYDLADTGTWVTTILTPPAGTMDPNVHGFVFGGLRATATDASGNTSELTTAAVPVPEPGSLAGLAAGVVGLFGLRGAQRLRRDR